MVIASLICFHLTISLGAMKANLQKVKSLLSASEPNPETKAQVSINSYCDNYFMSIRGIVIDICIMQSILSVVFVGSG